MIKELEEAILRAATTIFAARVGMKTDPVADSVHRLAVEDALKLRDVVRVAIEERHRRESERLGLSSNG